MGGRETKERILSLKWRKKSKEGGRDGEGRGEDEVVGGEEEGYHLEGKGG